MPEPTDSLASDDDQELAPAIPDDPTDAAQESDGAQHRRFKLLKDVKNRLDRYLTRKLPGLSRSRLQRLINEGGVSVNLKQPKSSTILRQGDVIDVIVPPPPIKEVPAEDIPLDVLHEDSQLIVLNKQADLVVHPARSNIRGTLVNALAWYFRHVTANGLQALSSIGVDEFRPGIVHRLDKDTTGVIVVAKTDEAHWRMSRQFEARVVQKYYLAIVHGEMEPPGGVIDEPIGPHPRVKEAFAVRHDDAARNAVTLYRLREIYDGYTLVELELKTGRTHQIRVHLNWLGHPIVGDLIYGGEPFGQSELLDPPRAAGSRPLVSYARDKEEGQRMWARLDQRTDMILRRPALHAAVIEFLHPTTNQPLRIQAPLAPDMAQAIRLLRQRRPRSGPLPAQGAQVNLDSIMA
jgi:23S rRNA pseudouridine1911/1915/1917 synthase